MDDIENAFNRIKSRVVIDGAGCWNWQGAVTKDMYGQIRVGSRVMSTHRVSFTFANGSIPRGKVIRHQCDNRMCCNPAHLLVGDHEDNSQDIVDRQRHKSRRVLTADELQTVRTMRAAGVTKRAIAEALQCNWYTVSNAIDASGVDAPTRVGRPRGSRNLRTRVTEDAKKQMLDLYATGQHTQQQLAEQFGCDQTYVSLIVRGLK